jgi:DNA-binding IclR family transcriptional regulator
MAAPTPDSVEDGTRVQALARGLSLLEALAACDEVGLVELSVATGLRPSTTHRLLATLIGSGFAAQNPATGHYRLGHKVLELAGGGRGQVARLRRAARPHLEALAGALDETVNLVVLEGRSAVYVDQVESTRPVRMFTVIGRRAPAHATAAGKAMLAHADAPALERLWAAEPFERFTPRTIVGADALRAELAVVRGRGHAVEHDEFEEGVSCVAAAVLDHGGAVAGAVSVAAPSSRLARLDETRLAAVVVEAARASSAELGWADGVRPSGPAQRG